MQANYVGIRWRIFSTKTTSQPNRKLKEKTSKWAFRIAGGMYFVGTNSRPHIKTEKSNVTARPASHNKPFIILTKGTAKPVHTSYLKT